VRNGHPAFLGDKPFPEGKGGQANDVLFARRKCS